MLTIDELRDHVARFKANCAAVCAETRQMLLANRALMRIPQHAKRSRLIEHNKFVEERHRDVARIFARAPSDLLRLIDTDLDLALTFADMSQQACEPERKHRLARNAFIAYETVLRLRAELPSSPDQKRELDAKLQRLKSKLAQLVNKPSSTLEIKT